MPNFFLENPDLFFHFKNLDIKDVVEIAEDDYKEKDKYDYAPVDYQDAMENYEKVLEIVGDIAGNVSAENASEVDRQGAKFEDGKVSYASGTTETLNLLKQAELMGMAFPREYGGLNFPSTIYMMTTEILSRADASMMNVYGLQDIADTISKFGSEEQKQEFIPKFATGEYLGAMALTEPDAGSDLQSVKMHAYQDAQGRWFLKGVKRFITNGNAHVLLVLARSEEGTKDARGLSLFACYNDDTVVIRRIENKLGIHGSPTCELQFNDTPCQLVGARRFGLIKYVIDLMFRARMGVSAQALGIAQAAYEEALKYAKARVQFGKPIYEIPVVTDMLIQMRVRLESSRSLFYLACLYVDRKEKLEGKIERLKKAGLPYQELNLRLKDIVKIANLLVPLAKYVLTENSNKIAYDGIQIHGGTGYMKEFKAERFARDARITNIYEGTSQLQIVAAQGAVINDVMKEHLDLKEAKDYKGGLKRLQNCLKEIRLMYFDCLKYVMDKKDPDFQDIAAKDLVDLYSYMLMGYLLLDESERETRKIFVANRYILSALASARKNMESIKAESFNDVMHADEILI